MSMRDDLKAFVDGELAPSREDEIRKAIETDQSLKAEVDELQRLSQSIRVFADVPAPVGLERTLRAVRPKSPWWSPNTSSGRLAWGACALVLLAIGFSVVLPRLSSQGSRSDSMSVYAERTAVSTTPADTAEGLATPDKAPAPAGAMPLETRGGIEFKSKSGEAPRSDGWGRDATSEPTLPPRNLRVRLRVPNKERAKDQVLALAGPLGGTAVEDEAQVTLEVPSRNTDAAIAGLNNIGVVDSDRAQQGIVAANEPGAENGAIKGEAIEPRTVIQTELVEDKPADSEQGRVEESSSSAVVLAILLGIAAFAGAGVLWAIRKRA